MPRKSMRDKALLEALAIGFAPSDLPSHEFVVNGERLATASGEKLFIEKGKLNAELHRRRAAIVALMDNPGLAK